MKIAIVVYSQSGATATVAKKLSDTLTARGHEVDTTLLRTSGNVSSRSEAFELRSIPDVAPYDCIVIGGPVMGFRASKVVMKFMVQLGKLKGKKVLCMVTKGLPFTWTGGTQALRAMEEELSLSQANLLPGTIIFSWQIRNQVKLERRITDIATSCTT